MRVIVFFDVPMLTSENIRNYNKMRKSLIKDGFIMLQESIYCKLVMNPSIAFSVKERVRKYSAPEGVIQILVITEKQYASIEYIVGGLKTNIVNTTDRILII